MAMQGVALDGIGKEIREATTSMTSVPKPLKFLRKHYAGLVDFFKGGGLDLGETILLVLPMVALPLILLSAPSKAGSLG